MLSADNDSILEYLQSLHTEVSNAFTLNGEVCDEAFMRHVMRELESADLVEDYDIALYKGETGVRDHQGVLGAYSYSSVDSIFNVFVPLYLREEEYHGNTLMTEDLRKLVIQPAINFIKERASIKEIIPTATACLDCIESIDENIDALQRFRIHVLTNAFVGEKVKLIKPTMIDNKIVDFVVYDVQRLYEFSIAQEGRGSLQIDFSQYTPAIRCVKVNIQSSEDSHYDSYIGVVPGAVLATIYDTYGARLLEGNVRSFLTSKVATNKKIRETLLRMPEQFFAFNNGISVTAENIKIDEKGYLQYAEEFQIINGGQTTASISQARFKDKADLSKVSVLMKLTVTKQGVDEDEKQHLLESISRASNQQNKVSDADFFSTHPFHRAIENLYEKAPTPTHPLQTYWFYERAKGQYNQRQLKMTKAERVKFQLEYPKRQVVTKTDLAKHRNSWGMLPHLVSKGAQTNFQKFAEMISAAWEKDSSNFNNLHFFKESIALAIMFNRVGEIVSSQTWYQGAFRANIVTYSIAILHHLINVQHPDAAPNLEIIWKLQKLPKYLETTFIQLTKLVNDVIIDTEGGIVNITQRCKQEGFWKRVKETVTLDLYSIEGFDDFLLSSSQSKEIKKEGRQQGRLLNDVEIQMEVYNKGYKFWQKVRMFAEESRYLDIGAKESRLLTLAGRKGSILDPKDAKMLLNFLVRCEENGFKA